jgi:hypothetical protein
MANPNINKYNQASKDAYLPTQPGITPAQQERLDAARKTYEVVHDIDDHALPPRQLYQKTLGLAQDKVVEGNSSKLISRDVDGAIAKYMLEYQKDPEKVAQTLSDHSPFAAKMSPEQQQQYGSGLTKEMQKKIDQEQNQRPERSLQNSPTPKTASLDARYRDVATQDAQARHGTQAQNIAQYQKRER